MSFALRCFWSVALLAIGCPVLAQDDALPFPPVPDEQVARYTAYRSSQPILVDGQPNEPDWQRAKLSPRFVDLVSGRRAIHNTQAAVLWDDHYLYVAYWIEEPFVRAKFTERDSPIWQDNDVELFVAGEDAYYELEINAHGTLYEGLFVWQQAYQDSGFERIAELDRRRPEVKWQAFNGVGYRNHPRGKRWAFLAWDFPEAKMGVHIDGTLNDDSDRDRGWTVEMALPWRHMKPLNLGKPRPLPPEDGDVWRMDFSRFNQYREAPPAEDSGGWAWSYHGVWDSHIPECFPYITFSHSTTPDSEPPSP